MNVIIPFMIITLSLALFNNVFLINKDKLYRLMIKRGTKIEQSYTCISVTIFNIEKGLSSIWNITISVTFFCTFKCNFLFN